MDFFAEQARARRATWAMLAMFAIAVVAVMAMVHVMAAALLWADESRYLDLRPAFEPYLWDDRVMAVAIPLTLVVVLGASAFRVWQLASGGGAEVARSLGGRLVSRGTVDPLEMRLLNVVEEMAIASGVPVPPVYVLDGEGAINAFAAGFAPDQAVIGITGGALARLDRDQLQGVVAHEFSHVLNGDMRLNIRMAGVVHGLRVLYLAGRFLLRGSLRGGSGSGKAFVVTLGAALTAIGWFGAMLGAVIMAATSRQREYLADAAAIQFTRNPKGLAGALRKIADEGSGLSHPAAAGLSHLFFGQAVSGLLDTHPAIALRLARLGEDLPAAVGDAEVARARLVIDELPAALATALARPQGASEVVLAMVASDGRHDLSNALAAVPAEHWPAVVDMAVPALLEMDGPARKQFMAAFQAAIDADGRHSVFEHAAARLLRKALGRPDSGREVVGGVDAAVARVMAAIVHAGHGDEAGRLGAHNAARAILPGLPAMPGPPPRDDGALDGALDLLGGAPLVTRRAVMQAAARAAQWDGRTLPEESRMLTMLAQALGLPAPPPGLESLVPAMP